MPSRHSLLFRVALIATVVGGTQVAVRAHGGETPVPALPSGTPKGYLPFADLPDSLALLPPPPSPGTPAFDRDEADRQMAETLRGTARWTLATSDAVLHFPKAASVFACAANLPIAKETMPRLYGLLGRTLIDVGYSTYRAKNQYKRVRPFVVHHDASCMPEDEAFLSTDGSYPSGHSAAGWGWALLLAEIVPDRANQILQRGRDFGESRIVCNVHWRSDVETGRIIASATIARLHADPMFAADLTKAKVEVSTLTSAERMPASTCAAEAAALAP